MAGKAASILERQIMTELYPIVRRVRRPLLGSAKGEGGSAKGEVRREKEEGLNIQH